MFDTDPTRRAALTAMLAAGGGAALVASAPGAFAQGAAPGQPPADGLTGHEHDWDWLVGRWNVRHSRLRERLAGSRDWDAFNGTSQMWLTLGGLGTVDDNVLELPAGTYRAVGVRAFDPKAGQWSIWWLDGRDPTDLEPPVHGGFAGGVGTFLGDDTLRGRPVKVRYLWTAITLTSAHWEQAFSPDAGATWETNWRMDFTRAA